ncbi:MAG: aspartate aminotransferase [Planctomycetota bacterium]|nr:MAG: aspartate aminotransferase [Planctomycetota bacterium]
MSYDFDTVINRHNTGSLKWDYFKDPDVISMWVADMDFKVASPILEALHKEIDFGVLGYSQPQEKLNELIIERISNNFNWEINKDWIVWLPGLVPALNAACRGVGNDGHKVLTITPIYPPFLTAPRLSRRKREVISLKRNQQKWELDFEEFEKQCADGVKLLLLCNPHNPVGKVYTKDELENIFLICDRYDIVVCSDEIHCDLILNDELNHIPYASIHKNAEKNSITLMAPSKTFNIPGLNCAYAIIPDKEIRDEFNKSKEGIIPYATGLGYSACYAAYKECHAWRQELLVYLNGNLSLLQETVNSLENVSMIPPEATYLAWVNISKLQIENPMETFASYGLGISPGKWFQDKDYIRINFGTSKSQMEKAMDRFRKAVNEI